jgi:hypothetical protein
MVEVFQDVDIGKGKSADQIRTAILAAYADHGHEPPSDFSWWSRFIAAGTGRRGTRSIRLVRELFNGLRAVEERLADSSVDQ